MPIQPIESNENFHKRDQQIKSNLKTTTTKSISFPTTTKKLNHKKLLTNKHDNYFKPFETTKHQRIYPENLLIDDLFNVNMNNWRPAEPRSIYGTRLKELRNEPTELTVLDGLTNIYGNLYRFMMEDDNEQIFSDS